MTDKISRCFVLIALTLLLGIAWLQPVVALAAAAQSATQPAVSDADRAVLLNAGEAYNAKKYADAVRLLQPLAEKGNATAAFSMGLMEARGNLGTPDYLKARQWWEIAARQNHPEAEFNLGLVYARGVQGGGDGTDVAKKDYAKAREWWERAATHGHGGAMYALGGMARLGEGQEKNFSEAARWYEQAANLGHPDAQYQLGSMYLNGSGVERNAAEATKWMKLAAESGHPGAKQAMKLLEAQAGNK